MNKVIRLFTLASLAMCLFNSCIKDVSSADVFTQGAQPPIGNYSSSDDVAKDNLVAYWSFDGNANEALGGTTATVTGGATFTPGLRGQAYQGVQGAYATLEASAAFSNLPSYTLSVWYKLPSQPAPSSPEGLFFLEGTNTQNLMIYEIEHGNADTVNVHHGFTDLGSPEWQGFTMAARHTSAINQWVHLVTTYDGSSSNYVIYENGTPVGNNSAWGQNITPTAMWTNGDKVAPLGNLSFASDPAKTVLIGTWPAGLYGVSSTLGANGSFLGQIDELRIYKTALSQSDITTLYKFGKNGN